MKLPGLAYALTRSDLLAGRVANAPLQNMIRRSFHPTRSGHIHVVQKQYWMLHATDEAEKLGVENMAAIHGSPWTYDTYVPILFAGPGDFPPNGCPLGGPRRYRANAGGLFGDQTSLRFNRATAHRSII